MESLRLRSGSDPDGTGLVHQARLAQWDNPLNRQLISK
jgi:hypothetical protein